jgi:perosamine synthetase
LVVIEDAAEAHGASINGCKTGALAHCGVFSFYGNKVITCGEGGMLTTDDEQLYCRAKYLRDHAMSSTKRYWHDEIGFNYRITNLQAALGLAQLNRIDDFLSKKQAIFERYYYYLSDIPTVKLNFTAPWAANVFWLVCLEIEGLTDLKRDQLMLELKQQGIDSRPYFHPLSDMPMYRKPSLHTPIAHKVAQRGINLPSYFDLSNENIDYVSNAIRTWLGYAAKPNPEKFNAIATAISTHKS